MSRVTTHILDTARGRPAANVAVTLERADPDGNWRTLASARTDSNGRIAEFPGAGELTAARHRLRFDIAPYFDAQNVRSFFPSVEIIFSVTAPAEHHHVPLLLSPFGYTTYRGS
ncbi:MAG: hydroxyisourate hydrolase [Phycisphaerae bacterium]|nr:hydroxyisourate hydrolase [Phycisphaerae bacterium]